MFIPSLFFFFRIILQLYKKTRVTFKLHEFTIPILCYLDFHRSLTLFNSKAEKNIYGFSIAFSQLRFGIETYYPKGTFLE